MSTSVRSKPLVEYVASLGPRVLGIVTVQGYDGPAAALLASKRWRASREQVLVQPWDVCTPELRAEAAKAERNTWTERAALALAAR